MFRLGILAKYLSPAIVYKYMSTSQNDGDKQPAAPDIATVTMLLGTIGDTTWRMFVPTVGMTVLGLLADKWLHTTPWIMIAGILLGSYLAYVLVKRQVKKVQQTK